MIRNSTHPGDNGNSEETKCGSTAKPFPLFRSPASEGNSSKDLLVEYSKSGYRMQKNTIQTYLKLLTNFESVVQGSTLLTKK